MLFIIWCITCCIGVFSVNAESWDKYCKCWEDNSRYSEYSRIRRCINGVYKDEQGEEPRYTDEQAKECWEIETQPVSSSTFRFKSNTPLCRSIRTHNASREVLKDLKTLRLPRVPEIVHVLKFLFKFIGAGGPCQTWIEKMDKNKIELDDLYTALNMKVSSQGDKDTIAANCDSFKSRALPKLTPWKGKIPRGLYNLGLYVCSQSPSSQPCTYLLIYHVAVTAGKGARVINESPAVCDAFRLLLLYYDFHLIPENKYESRFVTVNKDVLFTRILKNLHKWVENGIKDDRIQFYYNSLSLPENNKLFSNVRKVCDDKDEQGNPVSTSLMCQLLNIVSKLVEILAEMFNEKVKVVDTEFDYKMYLEGEQIKGNLDEKLSQLGGYLTKIQEFERRKAEQDIKYVRKRLELFGETFNQVRKELGDILWALLEAAGVTAIANTAMKTAIAAVATSGAALNPLFSTGMLNAVKAYGAVSAAVAKQIVVANLHNAIVKLKKETKDIGDRFQKGMETLLWADKYVNPERKEHERFTIDQDVRNFLNAYGRYDPGVQRNEIQGNMQFWTAVYSSGCKNFRDTSGNTVGAALRLAAIEKQWCTKYPGLIAQLEGLLLEMYDFQRKFLESSALFLRAKLGEANAATLGKRVEEVKNQNNLKKEELVMLGTILYELTLQSIVYKYCVSFEYRNGGVPAPECEDRKPDISKLIIRKVRRREPVTFLIQLPEITSSNNDTSSISLEYLAKGDDVFFQIPNYDWLVKAQESSIIRRDDVYYVNLFGLFLPYMTSNSVVLTRGEVVGESELKTGGTRYILARPYKTMFEYKEGVNQLSCPTDRVQNPYTICRANPLPEYCPVTVFDGTIDCDDEKMTSPFPSIYSKWKFNVRGYEKFTKPIPSTKVKIKAVLVLCKFSENVRNLSYKRQINGRPERTCCYGDTYYNTKRGSCTACPSESKGALNGYYCKRNAPPEQQNARAQSPPPRPAGRENS